MGCAIAQTNKPNKQTKKMPPNNERQMEINEEIGWLGGVVRREGARGERPEGG